MSADESVFIAGAYEHPTRNAPDKSTMQLHAEVAKGALSDAGLKKSDVDGYLTAGIPEHDFGLTPLVMADYLGLDVSFFDSTDVGGSAFISHLGHAVNAIRENKCDVALVTLAGRPQSRGQATGTGTLRLRTMQDNFERVYGLPIAGMYAMAAQRHMHEYGTTNEQLAEIRVAASHHAQFNEHAVHQEPVTVEDVVNSREIAPPLNLLDCCIITDGGGAFIVVSDEVREELDRQCVEVLGHGEAIGHHERGQFNITETAAVDSGRRAFEESGVGPDDIDYVSIYDSFTYTVLTILEDLGFCEKGQGGSFVEGGTLQAPDGDLPFNTDGGGLCSNHPANRGGMTKVIEAVRQLRGEANPEVQVDADFALAHGNGGILGSRHGSVTAVLGRVDR
jgi:acetyl-CoA C-acetyltransferase